MTQTCAAWDYGSIRQAIESLTGLVVEQRTTKTLCGRRRRLKFIDNDFPSCPACRAIAEEERKPIKGLEF